MRWLKSYALYFAWVVSVIGLLLSLFFGEMLRFEPCRLCWYQRIALFPLALILGLAAYREDNGIAIYALPLCFLGGLFALYQLMETYIPFLNTPVLCGSSADCSERLFEVWGFVTFPLLSLFGFIAMFALLWIARSGGSEKASS
jgi:disulfide bond formation protein DsbB